MTFKLCSLFQLILFRGRTENKFYFVGSPVHVGSVPRWRTRVGDIPPVPAVEGRFAFQRVKSIIVSHLATLFSDSTLPLPLMCCSVKRIKVCLTYRCHSPWYYNPYKNAIFFSLSFFENLCDISSFPPGPIYNLVEKCSSFKVIVSHFHPCTEYVYIVLNGFNSCNAHDFFLIIEIRDYVQSIIIRKCVCVCIIHM